MPTKVTRSAKPAPRKGPVFPVRKPKLVKAADAANVVPVNTGKIRAHYVGKAGFYSVIWGQHVLFSVLLLTLVWAGFYVHRTLALAEVGALTCSAENSLMWLEEDPGSKVPRLNDAVMNRCAKAYNPLG
jgi:hypothetical protein